MEIFPAMMISPDNHQSGVFALSTTVWLKTHGIKSCNLTEIGFQFFNHFNIALGLVYRSKRVNIGKIGV